MDPDKQMDSESLRREHSLLRWFKCDHLPEDLKRVALLFGDTAYRFARLCPPGREATVALHKLLEAKDAAVRAVIEAREEE